MDGMETDERPRGFVIEEMLKEMRQQRPRAWPAAAAAAAAGPGGGGGGGGGGGPTNITTKAAPPARNNKSNNAPHNDAPYGDRPEWRGVRPRPPLPTDAAGGGAVVAIADPATDGGAAAREMRGLFRATALRRGERSARVRDLCADMVRRLNPADYTAWAVRWECVVALAAAEGGGGGDGGNNPAAAAVERRLALLAEEDAFTRRVAREAGTKNYQLWNHRRKIAMASLGLDDAMPVVVVAGGGGEVGAAAPSLSAPPQPPPPPPPPPPRPALAAALARELSFADLALKGTQDDDHKNYHAWAHRQAALSAAAGQMLRARREARASAAAAGQQQQQPGGDGNNNNDEDIAAIDAVVWTPELLYCEAALRDDVRNNSAWAQRMFALLRGRAGGGGGLGGVGESGSTRRPDFPSAASLLLPADVVDREIGFVADALLRAPRNESAWSYLCGLLGGEAPPARTTATTTTRTTTTALPSSSSSSSPPQCWPRKVHELCCGVLEDDPNCAPALDTLAGFYAALARAAAARWKKRTGNADEGSGGGGAAAALAAARAAADNARAALRAAEVADPIRRNYWRWRASDVREVVG